MIQDFYHIFEFEGSQWTGNEFLTFFVSALYCRVFIANQTIVKRLEHFSEFYLIHKGSVTISLSHKDQNEFFTLHPSNYFGDYQILMDLRASECYKSSVDSATYTHCLKKKDLQDLMVTFPDAKATFVERARLRRIEFRRIKKQFEKFANVDKQADLDNTEYPLNPDQFAIQHYSDKSKDQPPYLQDPDFYFEKTDLASIPMGELEQISDSEEATKQSQEDLERKQKDATKRSLDFLVKQIDATNEALKEVKKRLKDNAEKTIAYISDINCGKEKQNVPTIDNLQNCLNDLNTTIQMHSNKA